MSRFAPLSPDSSPPPIGDRFKTGPSSTGDGFEPPTDLDARVGSRGPSSKSYGLATFLFVLTLFTSTTLGAGWYLSTRTDVTTDLLPWLGPATVNQVWSDPELIRTGLSFSIPLLIILLSHELGHFLMCRRYGIPSTPPYFLPVPFGVGTFGAFIRIQAPIRDKRQLFDVGAGGPLAGFAALLPFLFFGIARSTPAPLSLAADPQTAPLYLILPGKSLAIELVTRLFHGELPVGTVLDFHPFALAAWVGLLVTALNLIPLGQLDGGHVLYSVFGRRQRALAIPLWILLLVAGMLYWRGWILWCVIVLIMGIRHPPVMNEIDPLDERRKLLAFAVLILFVLSFIPRPVSLVGVLQ